MRGLSPTGGSPPLSTTPAMKNQHDTVSDIGAFIIIGTLIAFVLKFLYRLFYLL
jgi:hypothetical protein